MDIKEIVREEAAKTYTDTAELAAFMEGFEKQAGLWSNLGQGILNESPRAIGMLAAGVAGATIVGGARASLSALNNNALKSKFETALQYVINTNKIVKGGKPDKVRSYAQTLFSFAPHVASDQNLLSTLLANAVLGEGIDPMTIKSVTDLEGRYKENNAYGPFPTFKA